MRLWKIALLVAIVASGFGTGYVWKHRQTRPQPMAAASRSTTPDYEPSLILPPPDNKGVIIDPPIDDVRDHIYELAGFGKVNPLKMNCGLCELWEEANRITPVEARNNWPPLDVVPATFPSVIRLPAPDEEQQPSSAVRRSWHRQTATWMYTNRREVRLNFEVTRQCVAGIRAVELWCRRAPGAAYECVNRMEGSKPPFTTRLWSEGNYEFRVVVVDGLGAKTPPSEDELPDIYVCLDTTLPIIEMQRPVFESPGVVKLSWLAGDRNLDDNPIRLEFTVDGQSWKPLAERDAWLPNTGQFLWIVPEGLSEKVRFRAFAR